MREYLEGVIRVSSWMLFSCFKTDSMDGRRSGLYSVQAFNALTILLQVILSIKNFRDTSSGGVPVHISTSSSPKLYTSRCVVRMDMFCMSGTVVLVLRFMGWFIIFGTNLNEGSASELF